MHDQQGAPGSVTRPEDLAPFIQHTLIEVGTTRERMLAHAEESVRFGFNAAMVPGTWVRLVAAVLRGTGVAVASALDFPVVGVTTPAGKAAEAAELVRLGADQIDMGTQIGWLKSGMYDAFRDDIAGVVNAAGVPVKVMLELPLLTPAERQAAVELSLEAGATWLKNASGGAVETASAENIRWLADRAPDGVRVKASGSIKSAAQVEELLTAGASLVGTSAGIAIVTATADAHVRSY